MKRLKNLIKKANKQTKNFATSVYWLAYQAFFRNFKCYNELSSKANANKLIVLANGPSLKGVIDHLSLDKKGIEYLVVNFFGCDSHFYTIKPSHYVLADPEFFITNAVHSDTVKELYNVFNTNVTWSMNLYVPLYAYKKLKLSISNPYIKLCPFHNLPYEGWDFIKQYLYRKGLSMPKAQNVLIPSIFIGINNGYKLIELYGVDHSWTTELKVNDQNQVCTFDSHFYDLANAELKPFYRGAVGDSFYKMHELLRDLAFMFEGYHKLRLYADLVGCRVINRTPESFIDAFERKI